MNRMFFVNTIGPSFLGDYFGTLQVTEVTIECISEMMRVHHPWNHLDNDLENAVNEDLAEFFKMLPRSKFRDPLPDKGDKIVLVDMLSSRSRPRYRVFQWM